MEQLEQVVVTSHRRGAYGKGYRYCSKCRKFILTREVRCPICRTLMRSKSRSRRWKAELPRIDV